MRPQDGLAFDELGVGLEAHDLEAGVSHHGLDFVELVLVGCGKDDAHVLSLTSVARCSPPVMLAVNHGGFNAQDDVY